METARGKQAHASGGGEQNTDQPVHRFLLSNYDCRTADDLEALVISRVSVDTNREIIQVTFASLWLYSQGDCVA
jgi:hypothetical protein